ncbi:MAG: hypothetical protein ACKOFP_08125 [Actinomycetota bacterium]
MKVVKPGQDDSTSEVDRERALTADAIKDLGIGAHTLDDPVRDGHRLGPSRLSPDLARVKNQIRNTRCHGISFR